MFCSEPTRLKSPMGMMTPRYVTAWPAPSAPKPLRDERARELDRAGAEARCKARLPRNACRIGGTRRGRGELGGKHDEKHVREERHGVDAVGQGTRFHARTPREGTRLVRI